MGMSGNFGIDTLRPVICIMGRWRHFSIESYVWRLDIVHNLCEYCSFFLHDFLCPKSFDLPNSHTTRPLFIPNYNWLSCELDNFTFTLLYWAILYWYYINCKINYNVLTVSFKNFKIVYFNCSRMKNIAVIRGRSRFPIKLICCIAFVSASSTYHIFLNDFLLVDQKTFFHQS